MAAELWKTLTEEERNRFFSNVLMNLPLSTGDNLMLKFRKADKVQALRDLVEMYPDGTPTMMDGDVIDRIKAADPGVNLTEVVTDALKAHAVAAESQELARKKKETRCALVLDKVQDAIRGLKEVEHRLLTNTVTDDGDGVHLNGVLKDVHQCVRSAGARLRNTFGIKAPAYPPPSRRKPPRPRGRLTPRRYY